MTWPASSKGNLLKSLSRLFLVCHLEKKDVCGFPESAVIIKNVDPWFSIMWSFQSIQSPPQRSTCLLNSHLNASDSGLRHEKINPIQAKALLLYTPKHLSLGSLIFLEVIEREHCPEVDWENILKTRPYYYCSYKPFIHKVWNIYTFMIAVCGSMLN